MQLFKMFLFIACDLFHDKLSDIFDMSVSDALRKSYPKLHFLYFEMFCTQECAVIKRS